MDFLLGKLHICRPKRHIFVYRHFKQLVFRVLERQPNAAAYLLQFCFIFMDIFPVQQDFSGGRGNDAIQMLYQGGFAGACMSYQPNKFPRLYLYGNIIQRFFLKGRPFIINMGQMADFN